MTVPALNVGMEWPIMGLRRASAKASQRTMAPICQGSDIRQCDADGLPSCRIPPVVAAGIVVLLGVLLAGCSTAALTAGANLAKVGQTAATETEQNVTLSGNTVTSLKRAVAFNDGFNGQIGNPSSQEFLTNMTAIQRDLSQYGKMLGSLSGSYVGLGELAGYDSAGSFNSSIDTLATDAKNFGSTIGKPVNFPTEATSGIKAAGGFFIGQAQARDVKDASRKIELILKQVIALLDDSATREKLIPVQTLVGGQIEQAAETLFLTGANSYGPLMDDLGVPLGLKSTSASDAAVKGNIRLQAGLRNVAIERGQEQIDLMADSYDTNLAALNALIPLHDSLQNDEALDLTAISSLIGQLQIIAASLQPTKGK